MAYYYRAVWYCFYLFAFYFIYTSSKVSETLALVSSSNGWAQVFSIIFLFRYVRLLVNLVAFCTFASVLVPEMPTLLPADVTVIVPSVEPYGEEFQECIQSILKTGPAEIIVVTAGSRNLAQALPICQWSPSIRLLSIEKANKRAQVCRGLKDVRTSITILCDDHVFWPRGFLPHVLAPFEDRNIGAVGTCKRVRRQHRGFSFSDFWNFIGALYLERHNFEIAATSRIDGGVFCISGRTSAHRTAILHDPGFIDGFLNEYTFYGLVGPLNADDDNFITRWMVNHGWKIRIQYSDNARIETTLGEYPKFLLQCLRWTRTTWRSNPASLFVELAVWRTQPWCVYAVYLSSFFNFALFYDSALFLTLWFALDHWQMQVPDQHTWFTFLGVWILLSKLVKPFPHFWRNPKDLVYLPGSIMFGYFHSFIKLYAMFTFWVTAWGSRKAVDTQTDEADGSPKQAKVECGLRTWVLVTVAPPVTAGLVYIAGRYSTMAMLYLTRLSDSYYDTDVK